MLANFVKEMSSYVAQEGADERQCASSPAQHKFWGTSTKVVGLVLLLLCIVALASAQQQPTFTVYPVPGVSGAPPGITTGPDGALWFTTGNSIWRSTTAGVMTEYPLPDDGVFYSQGRGASDITLGPDGALWFTEIFASKIGRITTAGVISEYSLPTGDRGPMKIATGPDGALWFTEWISQNGDVARITTSGTVSRYQLSNCSGNCYQYPSGITTGPDGALWVADPIHRTIYRITTAGVITYYDLPSSPYGVQPGDITTGPDGALWFTLGSTAGPNDHIGRITTAGVITAYPLPIYQRPSYNGYNNLAPNSIVAGPDGAIWFTSQRISVIGRITPLGDVTIYPLASLSAGEEHWSSRAITVGPDRALWITDDGSIVRASLQADTTPPTITLSATPKLLRPRDGRMVPVTISGKVADSGSGLMANTLEYTVIDEYGFIQPKGHMTWDSAGNYSFTILLRASAEDNDPDGRLYTIRVNVRDNAGNRGAKSTSVRAPL